MYRIKFVTKGGFWVVQLAVLGMFWLTVKEKKAVPTSKNGIMDRYQAKQFDKLADAEKYVDERGIPDAYQRKELSFGFFEAQQPAQVVQMVPAQMVVRR